MSGASAPAAAMAPALAPAMAPAITPAIARLVRSEDFERVLRTRTRVRSPHFAVHHLADRPSVCAKPVGRPVAVQLSTGNDQPEVPAVDDSVSVPPPVAPGALWLGAVVPKRHARRSVTRTLLKRQIRAVVTGHAASLAAGLWIVRLRAPFERAAFVSAASNALKHAARVELERLLHDAARAVATR